jgi:Flp pilus assembly protein TadD
LDSAIASPPESAADKANLQFNYGFALFLNKNYEAATKQLLLVVARDQKDGEAYFLLSKAFEKLNDTAKATDASEKAKRFLTANNRYAKLELEWKNSNIESISPRVIETPRADFALVVLPRGDRALQLPMQVDEVKGLLQQAKDLYKAGRDDDALNVIVRILISNPMQPEAHLIRGNIRMRRGELEQAVADLKTALFWDYNILEAHLALGRIFYEKRDCQQAETYSRSAIEVLRVRKEKIIAGPQDTFTQSAADLDRDTDEVAFLSRLVEKCKK